MANVNDKVNAELENIERVLNELKQVKDKPNKELVVLVGIGAFLQNIYMGIENILKQLLLYSKVSIPDSSSWHKDLLKLSLKKNILTDETVNQLGIYLFFRHFFSHAYGFLIEEEKLKPLMDDISETYSKFKEEINEYLSKLENLEI